jgi:hypothetical protein
MNNSKFKSRRNEIREMGSYFLNTSINCKNSHRIHQNFALSKLPLNQEMHNGRRKCSFLNGCFADVTQSRDMRDTIQGYASNKIC